LLIFLIVFILLLVIFFSFSIVALSRISINKDATISSHVIFVRVPYAVHIFNVINFLGLENLFALSAIATVLSGPRFLSRCTLFRWFCLSELSRLFWSRNLSRVFSSAVIIFSTVHLNSSLLCGSSLQKSWNCHLARIP
jgi:hypothetical protein